MKIRIKFSKHGNLRFIGHLDLMRYFQKAMRRADIPIRYSEGYSPHQIMSFASPLGTGLESDCEYMDIELQDGAVITPQEAVLRLNEVMCEGMEILEWKEMSDKTKPGMSTLSEAEYEILCDISQEDIDRLLALKNIIIQKTTKKGDLVDKDIRPMIYELRKIRGGVWMRVAQGSSANLRPDEVLSAAGIENNHGKVRITRVNMKL